MSSETAPSSRLDYRSYAWAGLALALAGAAFFATKGIVIKLAIAEAELLADYFGVKSCDEVKTEIMGKAQATVRQMAFFCRSKNAAPQLTSCSLEQLAQIFLEEGEGFCERHALLALVPTLVYGAISLLLNASGAYSGPYPFLRVLEQPGYATAVGCIAVLAVNYAAARLLALGTALQRK